MPPRAASNRAQDPPQSKGERGNQELSTSLQAEEQQPNAHLHMVPTSKVALTTSYRSSTPGHRPSASGSSQAMHPQNKRNPPHHMAVANSQHGLSS
ncbi:hypothetical protein Nepgr_013492 [Nepenthes gracilis]|uniref:Uncharacterized protein n=1 Tax=Nepenthes gracilis TaxID=150966 RepID=A0AAD3SJV0_NEPGR|nr:hypothetical protein Nepgr_013492 [Nepenthes gracilis]